ncbi:MAG: ABC transporter ATP-binding protein [Gemmatimonadales bacterium]|nr:ABC transporter ATP-binding protein [Gemmatimonadales bacterium]
MSALLGVEALSVAVPARDGEARAVEDVSFTIAPGEFVALVGESGGGKSLTALALLGLLPPPARIAAGHVRLEGRDLVTLESAALRAVRGRRVAMTFQEPLASLTPVLPVGAQVREVLEAHRLARGAEARARAVALLDEVGIPDPAQRYDAFPHQLSGGLRQRVLLALALAAEPALLVADEPTTALDVTVQAQVLALLQRLRRDRGLGVLFVTHDLGLVAEQADRVLVMYAGRIVEAGPTAALFARPAHPYTRALLAAVPRLDGPPAPPVPIPGAVPAPGAWPPGCRFAPRCQAAHDACAASPPLRPAADGHAAACWLVPTT